MSRRGVLSEKDRRALVEGIAKQLEKYIMPTENRVETEINRPVVHDERAEALDPLGCLHYKPGPDIYIRVHIALGVFPEKPKKKLGRGKK